MLTFSKLQRDYKNTVMFISDNYLNTIMGYCCWKYYSFTSELLAGKCIISCELNKKLLPITYTIATDKISD